MRTLAEIRLKVGDELLGSVWQRLNPNSDNPQTFLLINLKRRVLVYDPENGTTVEMYKCMSKRTIRRIEGSMVVEIDEGDGVGFQYDLFTQESEQFQLNHITPLSITPRGGMGRFVEDVFYSRNKKRVARLVMPDTTQAGSHYLAHSVMGSTAIVIYFDEDNLYIRSLTLMSSGLVENYTTKFKFSGSRPYIQSMKTLFDRTRGTCLLQFTDHFYFIELSTGRCFHRVLFAPLLAPFVKGNEFGSFQMSSDKNVCMVVKILNDKVATNNIAATAFLDSDLSLTSIGHVIDYDSSRGDTFLSQVNTNRFDVLFIMIDDTNTTEQISATPLVDEMDADVQHRKLVRPFDEIEFDKFNPETTLRLNYSLKEDTTNRLRLLARRYAHILNKWGWQNEEDNSEHPTLSDFKRAGILRLIFTHKGATALSGSLCGLPLIHPLRSAFPKIVTPVHPAVLAEPLLGQGYWSTITQQPEVVCGAVTQSGKLLAVLSNGDIGLMSRDGPIPIGRYPDISAVAVTSRNFLAFKTQSNVLQFGLLDDVEGKIASVGQNIVMMSNIISLWSSGTNIYAVLEDGNTMVVNQNNNYAPTYYKNPPEIVYTLATAHLTTNRQNIKPLAICHREFSSVVVYPDELRVIDTFTTAQQWSMTLTDVRMAWIGGVQRRNDSMNVNEDMEHAAEQTNKPVVWIMKSDGTIQTLIPGTTEKWSFCFMMNNRNESPLLQYTSREVVDTPIEQNSSAPIQFATLANLPKLLPLIASEASDILLNLRFSDAASLALYSGVILTAMPGKAYKITGGALIAATLTDQLVFGGAAADITNQTLPLLAGDAYISEINRLAHLLFGVPVVATIAHSISWLWQRSFIPLLPELPFEAPTVIPEQPIMAVETYVLSDESAIAEFLNPANGVEEINKLRNFSAINPIDTIRRIWNALAGDVPENEVERRIVWSQWRDDAIIEALNNLRLDQAIAIYCIQLLSPVMRPLLGRIFDDLPEEENKRNHLLEIIRRFIENVQDPETILFTQLEAGLTFMRTITNDDITERDMLVGFFNYMTIVRTKEPPADFGTLVVSHIPNV